MIKEYVKKIDRLRIELLSVASEAPAGSHFEAARRSGITPDAELKIRQGKRCKENTSNNHHKLEKLIHSYNQIIKENK